MDVRFSLARSLSSSHTRATRCPSLEGKVQLEAARATAAEQRLSVAQADAAAATTRLETARSEVEGLREQVSKLSTQQREYLASTRQAASCKKRVGAA